MHNFTLMNCVFSNGVSFWIIIIAKEVYHLLQKRDKQVGLIGACAFNNNIVLVLTHSDTIIVNYQVAIISNY